MPTELPCVVHLVYGPLGLRPLTTFLETYRAMPAGRAHRLVIVFNQVEEVLRAEMEAELASLPHDQLHIAGLLDLQAYRAVVRSVPAPAYVFLNSYSRLLAGDWLDKLLTAAELPGVGIAGASGSWQSVRSFMPWFVRGTELPPHKKLRLQAVTARSALMARAAAPSAPNPYVRTNGFAMLRSTLSRIRWPETRTKLATVLLEGGRNSLSRQVQRLGLRPVVVSSDGRAHEVPNWPESDTYGGATQSGLLIADNRTDLYAVATAIEREHLRARMWEGRDKLGRVMRDLG